MTIPTVVGNSVTSAYNENNGEITETQSANSGTTGSDRCMVVWTITEYTSTNATVSGVTYNSVSMTEYSSSLDQDQRTQFFYLVAPATGTNDLVVTYDTNPEDMAFHWATYQDVDQTTVVHATSDEPSTGDSDTGGTDKTVTLTTTAADSLILTVSQYDTNRFTSPPDNMGVSANDTEVRRESSYDSGNTGRGFQTVSGKQGAATATSYTTGFNADPTSAEKWSIWGLELLAASAGGGGRIMSSIAGGGGLAGVGGIAGQHGGLAG